jgi:hypothetical protein
MTARVRMLGVPAPLAQLLGRDKERRVLGSALDRLARGRSIVVLIEGEPGIGKCPAAPSVCSSVH